MEREIVCEMNGGHGMDKKARIRHDIERKRDEMNKASVSHGISSKIVLKISQELDKLLNKYHHIQQ